ncbi:MAG TPA: tRNA (adenosine(37)-N6)-threonylcarbamoyltransferase complex dimerization subunit type 1 TsaB [Polyangiaceae bacterium]|nr:tRNA (adenosine(37)-N6)-threonylcarbamoyltransferase complex dimerization subunit type 1 TsaB [Polyangiaceae bacterium]
MLVLGIETSTQRGSVALAESGRLLAESWHDEPHAHGERLLGLINHIFNSVGRSPAEVSRVAAGKGPGAFTGLRVGIALAQGIATALGVRAVGVGSMQAMALGLDPDLAGYRWPVVDARRGELFIACYDPRGAEILAPRAVPRASIVETFQGLRADVRESGSAAPDWLLGSVVQELDGIDGTSANLRIYSGVATNWPSAAAVAKLASEQSELGPLSPDYHRDADAVLPKLPPSPLHRPRIG